jgi:hypothetical protein
MKNKFFKQQLGASAKACAYAVLVLGLGLNAGIATADKGGDKGKDSGRNGHVMWLNHFDLVSGKPAELATTSDSTTSGVGAGLTGLVIQSGVTGTPGDVFIDTGNKVVQMALDLPKETKITGVRVCYENSASTSFISQVRLAQIQDPPSSAVVMLDDATDLNAVGPVCVNSAITSKAIKSKNGPVLLSLRVNMANAIDKIVIRGLGVFVK